MNTIVESLNELAKDLLNTETVLLQGKKSEGNAQELIAYSCLELEGDSINFTNTDSENLLKLHTEITKTATACKKASWDFVLKALL